MGDKSWWYKKTAKNKNGHEITRNISFFKHFHGESQGDFDSDDDSSEAVVVDNRGATDERDQIWQQRRTKIPLKK